LSIARRALLDLPLAAGGTGASNGPSGPAAEPGRGEPGADFDLGSSFDVPAFLRRQEG
jgi:hypothetical protein